MLTPRGHCSTSQVQNLSKTRMFCSVLLVLCLSVVVSDSFFVDIIRDEVGPGTEDDDVIPRVWYRKRRQDYNSDAQFPPEPISADKRMAPSLLPVKFFCNKRTAICKNGGKGPRVTITRKGYGVCVCLCPAYNRGKQCGPDSQPDTDVSALYRRNVQRRYVKNA